MRYAVVALAVLLLAGSAFAGDIVTVPTANQLKQGQIDLAYYYLGLDVPGDQDAVQVQTVYLGLTDRIEVDAHRYDLKNGPEDIIVNATVALLRETATMPDLVIGGRNIGGTKVFDVPGSDKESWFIAAAKTLNLPETGPPKIPIVRLHAALGTEDKTLLGEERHDGLFGGVQILLTPEIGAVALHDSQDLITGLTYTPKNTGFTLKGGTYGDHWWVGLSWAK